MPSSSSSSTTLRQRKLLNKKKKQQQQQARAAQQETKENSNNNTPEDNDSVWHIVRNHWAFPLFVMTLVVGIPYSLYWSWFWLHLQHPEYLLGLVPTRPAVALNELRQVLIVGTVSSGTTQVAHELKQTLHLEVGHETSETQWNFVRDGTVSWFHGIRFLPEPNKASIDSLCAHLLPNMGIHPKMFRDTSGCSTREPWSACWRAECQSVLQQEWGCAWRNDNNDLRSCTSPFAKQLHQVRHPLPTISSLVVKFCVGGGATGLKDGQLHPSFLTTTNALFPDLKLTNASSCVEGTALYWLRYTKAMDMALQHGLLGARYQVETTSPCQVLELAGFLGGVGVVYPAHTNRLRALCGDSDGDLHQPMLSTEYKVNQEDLMLEWDDFLGGQHGSQRHTGDESLRNELQEWAKKLGYEEPKKGQQQQQQREPNDEEAGA